MSSYGCLGTLPNFLHSLQHYLFGVIFSRVINPSNMRFRVIVNKESRAALVWKVSFALGLVAISAASRADIGSCIAPVQPVLSPVLSDSSVADRMRLATSAYAVQSSQYGKCLIAYARQNSTALTASEKNSVRQYYDEHIKVAESYAKAWNRVYLAFLNKKSRTK